MAGWIARLKFVRTQWDAKSNPSDEIDTVAYAVSFMKAAKCLAEGEEEWEDNHLLIVPFYMLIGFSLENA